MAARHDLALVEENTTLAVENWADLQAKGGLNKATEWQDLTPIIQVLVELHKQRDTLMRLIFELSGISDLARGHTDPDETLGAQQLKQSFGSSRFKRREKESRRFAAEAYAIKGEVIAELFPREQLQEMSGVPLPLQSELDAARKQLGEIQNIQQQAEQARQQLAQLQQAQQQQGQPQPGQPPQGQPGQQMPPAPPPSPQAIAQLQQLAQTPPPDRKQVAHLTRIAKAPFSWEEIADVLQSDYRRCYSVEIETDQTNFMDQEADKQAATQLFQTVVQGLQQIAPMIQANPKTGDVFKKLFIFTLSRFRAGRAMEEDFERVFDEAIAMASQKQGAPPPDPKAEADKAVAQARVKTAEIGLQVAQVNLQKVQIEGQNKGLDVQVDAQKAQLKAVEGQQKVQTQAEINAAKREGQIIDNVNKAEKLQFERATRATAQEALLVGPTRKPNGAPAT